MKKVIQQIIKYLTNYGKGKIVSQYIFFACCLCGGFTLKSISYQNGNLKIDFETLDVIVLICLIVVLIPVCMLLYRRNHEFKRPKIQNESLYNRIFELLDIKEYYCWAHYISISGDLKLSVKQYENLNKVVSVIHNRIKIKKKSYQKIEDLLDNLALLVSDLITELNKHIITFGSQFYTVDKFYKNRGLYNPNYENDLHEYYIYCRNLSNLTIELTRLLNLLMQEIREKDPDFLNEIGRLFILEAFNELPIEYDKNEISSTPYPGIDNFLSIYTSRKNFI